jgi:hypothetical protein
LRLTGGRAHHPGMLSRRLIILAVVLAAAFVAVALASPGARREEPPSPAGGGSVPASAPGPALSVAGTTEGLDGSSRLEAVRTVKLFCDLVDARRYWPAAGLFSSRGVWTRAELKSVRALQFRSAHVFTAPDAATVTVCAAVRAAVRPGSPVAAGAGTLFFTLGRVGTTSGGWLIEAVTARPQPQRKGSQ